MMTKPKSNLRD